MAYTDQNIVITPNVGSNAAPQILFSAANNTVNAQNILVSAYPTSNGTLAFSGSAGQLFSITNQLTGTLFSVNDISGIPSVTVQDTGQVAIAPFNGYLTVGSNTSPISSNSNTTGSLVVYGGLGVTGNTYLSNNFTVIPTGSYLNTLQVSQGYYNQLTYFGVTSPSSYAGIQYNATPATGGASHSFTAYGSPSTLGQQLLLIGTAPQGGSAVNYFNITANTTGNSPTLSGGGSDTNVNISLLTKGSGTVNVSSTTANNYLTIAPGIGTFQYPTIGATGTDAAVGIVYSAKNSGIHYFQGAGGNQFAVQPIYNFSASVNYLQASGNSTANTPSLSAVGSDSTVSMSLIPKGNGAILINQTLNQGTGILQANGSVGISGNTTTQNLYVQGNNNLIKYSQALTQAGTWVSNQTPTTSSYVDPLGGTTATQFTTSLQNSGVYTFANIVPGVTYTWSVYLKYVSGDGNIYIGNQTNPTTATLVFNSSAGTLTSTGASLTNYGAINVTGSWYRVYGTFVATGTSAALIIYSANANAMSFAAWGYQLEVGAIASPYTPTTSSVITSNNNIYVPSAIGIGTSNPQAALHISQPGQTGYGIPSLILDQPSSSNLNGGATVIKMAIQFTGYPYANAAIVHDWYGSYFPSISASHGLNFVTGRSGFSNYHFRNTGNTNQLMITDSSQTGYTAPYNYGPFNGSVFTNQLILNQPFDSTQGKLNVSGSVYANGVATIQNIVMGGGNNLITYSQDFTNNNWTKQNVVVTSVGSSMASPWGDYTSVQQVTANNTGGYCPLVQSVNIANNPNKSYTLSGFFKANTATTISLNFGTGGLSNDINYNYTLTGSGSSFAGSPIGSPVSYSGSITSYNNGWYRCIVTASFNDYTTNSNTLRCDISVPSVAGANSVYMWGMQLEPGTVASIYTPTAGSQIIANNNITLPTGTVSSNTVLVTGRMSFANANNISVISQTYNAVTNSLDVVFG